MKEESTSPSGETKYKAKILLLLFRCEYLADEILQSPLTKKGIGRLPAKFWRRYNDVMCVVSKKHKITVAGILEYFYQQHKTRMN